MKFEKHTVINFHISFQNGTFSKILYKEKNRGSTLYHFEDQNREIIWYASDHNEEKVMAFLENLHYNYDAALATIYNQIGGIFELFIYDKKNKNLLIVNDLYGVNASFYTIKENELIFFSNFLNYSQLQIPLHLNDEGLQAHFALGYQVKPFPFPYKNITRLEGGKLYTFDENLSVETTPLTINYKNKTDSFSLENGLTAAEKLFFGATAGKDSLALLSQVKENAKNVIAGNFGNVYAADVLQGKEIAVNLELPYRHCTLCDAEEFEHYANEIALISGGMATISYVDMLKFVAETIPEDYSFVMGEAGECVRMFFPDNADITKAMDNYITPKEFLSSSFTNDYNRFLIDYPMQITDKISETYDGGSNAETLLNFYRKGRLPGNFGNRHKIIAAYRNKITPFLQEDFIKATHHLLRNHYKDDRIHGAIIYNGNQDLIQYFKNPIVSDVPVQNWHQRLQDEVGDKLYEMLKKHLNVLNQVFDAEKVLDFAKKQQKNPNRGVYFLFRILSMAIFVDNINNAVAPCPKR